jgi:hydroxymethylbilane synthase
MNRVVIGSRNSRLAMVQAEYAQARLGETHPSVDFVIEGFTTTGDRVLDRPIHDIGTKGLFTKELDVALLSGQIDLAVHSLKDLPAEMPEGIVMSCVPQRVEPYDCLLANGEVTFDELPAGSRVGTSSLRRRIQLAERRSDLELTDIRGNLNTRLRKLEEGQYDAIILALAGVKRLGWDNLVKDVIAPEICLPAPCQAALGITSRTGDDKISGLLETIEDARARVEVECERGFLEELGGGCVVPAGALSRLDESGEHITLHTFLADPAGAESIRRDGEAPASDARDLGQKLARELLDAGGKKWVEAAREQGK